MIVFEVVKPFQSNLKKNPIRKSTKTLLQQSAILNVTHNADNDLPIKKS